MNDIRARLDELVATSAVPGIQYVAVTADADIVSCAAGWADLARRQPMTPGTTLMAYSMSKTITAIAILQLAEAGRVELDAPVTRYLPESPYGHDVTVRQLIAHTGGLPNPIPLRWVHSVAEHATFDERAALAAVYRAHGRLSNRPGTRYAYSNVGYWMLGAIVDRVGGMPFTDYVTTHVLQPLGVSASDLGFEVADAAQHATGYLERWSFANLLGRWLLDRHLLGGYDEGWRRIGAHYPNGPAFGGLVGTARAFGRLLQDQLRAHSVLLGPNARALLYERQRVRSGLTPMTLGWHVGTFGETEVHFKEGGGGGFHCVMRLHLSRGFGSVVMTNATGFDVKTCAHQLDTLACRSLYKA